MRPLAQVPHGTSGTITAQGPQFTICPPKHRPTVRKQCYCAEEMSIIGTLEATGKFTALSFYWLSRNIAATNLDLFDFNLWATQEIKQGVVKPFVPSCAQERGENRPSQPGTGQTLLLIFPLPAALRATLVSASTDPRAGPSAALNEVTRPFPPPPPPSFMPAKDHKV